MTRVTLRDVREDDLPIFFEHQRIPRRTGWRSSLHGTSMRHGALGEDPGRLVTERTVEVDGAVVGNIVSWVHDDEREVGYWIGREHWGAGVATAALGAFLTIVEERPLFAHVVEHNVGSIRVLEKCGFALVDQVALPDEAKKEEGTERLYRLETDSRSAG